MIASLPMYETPANRAAHDAFWALVRDGLRVRGIAAPDHLDHEIPYMQGWAHPDLVLGQICNLPYRALFRGRVTVIGAADYGLPGCAAGYYDSVIIARPDGPQNIATARFACNDLLSNSGYDAPQIWAARQGVHLSPALMTGSHPGSIAAVTDGRADIAAIDAQTWRIAQRDNPNGLKTIAHTDTSPGMSFITKTEQDPAPYFDAIKAAIAALPDDTLDLRGIVALPHSAYDMPLPPVPPTIRA